MPAEERNPDMDNGEQRMDTYDPAEPEKPEPDAAARAAKVVASLREQRNAPVTGEAVPVAHFFPTRKQRRNRARMMRRNDGGKLSGKQADTKRNRQAFERREKRRKERVAAGLCPKCGLDPDIAAESGGCGCKGAKP